MNQKDIDTVFARTRRTLGRDNIALSKRKETELYEYGQVYLARNDDARGAWVAVNLEAAKEAAWTPESVRVCHWFGEGTEDHVIRAAVNSLLGDAEMHPARSAYTGDSFLFVLLPGKELVEHYATFVGEALDEAKRKAGYQTDLEVVEAEALSSLESYLVEKYPTYAGFFREAYRAQWAEVNVPPEEPAKATVTREDLEAMRDYLLKNPPAMEEVYVPGYVLKPSGVYRVDEVGGVVRPATVDELLQLRQSYSV